jgi:hypothetical protein
MAYRRLMPQDNHLNVLGERAHGGRLWHVGQSVGDTTE